MKKYKARPQLYVEEIQNHPEIVKYILDNRKYEYIPNFVKYIEAIYWNNTYKGYGTIDSAGNPHIRVPGSKVKEYVLGGSTYTFIKNPNKKSNDIVIVVEGIHDACAVMQWEDNRKNADIIILNSVVNTEKALKVIGEYDYIIIATDMDEAGEDAAQQITQYLQGKGKQVLRVRHCAKDIDEAYRAIKEGKSEWIRSVNY